MVSSSASKPMRSGEECCAHAVPRRLGEGEEGEIFAFIWFSSPLLILKKVAGPVLEASKDRDMRRIADFATLRKAPMVRAERIQ